MFGSSFANQRWLMMVPLVVFAESEMMPQFWIYSVGTAILLCGCVLSVDAVAQSASRTVTAQEYIQSTSPLARGGNVVSRAVPGRGVQTVTTIAQLPSINQSRSQVNPGFTPRATGVSAARQPYPNQVTARSASASGVYAYPARSRPVAAYPGPAFRPTAYQVPTLGLNPIQRQTIQPRLRQYRVAQNCNCAPVGNFGVANQAPAIGSGVPNLNIQMPGQVAPQPLYPANNQYQPGYGYGYGTPQYGAQGARWWAPFVTGSGVYTPLIRLQNLPPGTYLGQGIIGQPTAYVDGQPVRNLMRYIFP